MRRLIPPTCGGCRSKLALTRRQATVLEALREAGSAWLCPERVALALPPHVGDAAQVLALVEDLRAALGEGAVIYYVDAGYTLGAPGVLACRKALAPEAKR